MTSWLYFVVLTEVLPTILIFDMIVRGNKFFFSYNKKSALFVCLYFLSHVQ